MTRFDCASPTTVILGLAPRIHAFLGTTAKDVDGRTNKPGHDALECASPTTVILGLWPKDPRLPWA